MEHLKATRKALTGKLNESYIDLLGEQKILSRSVQTAKQL